SLDVDTGCLAAMTQTVDYDIRMVGGGIKSMPVRLTEAY
ncbi:hypothetical protein Pgy4_39295, partial [Pseudomonas savastanoi pv. glycinea str. race 4]